jgi:hypothetical protein
LLFVNSIGIGFHRFDLTKDKRYTFYHFFEYNRRSKRTVVHQNIPARDLPAEFKSLQQETQQLLGISSL